MKDNKACFSHNTDHWRTPINLYKYFMDQGYVDPCPYQSTKDCLQINYVNKKLFVNPPFSMLDIFVDWCIKQYDLFNCHVVILMPARTDTKYFHKLLKYNPFIFFFEKRLHFNDSKLCAPFPTILVSLGYGEGGFAGGTLDHYINVNGEV